MPFVLGPINGGVPWPKDFTHLRRAERDWLSPLRGLSRYLPGYTATRRYAAAILVGARSALAEMPERYHAKCVRLSENAIDLDRFPRCAPPALAKPLRVAFVGRLVPLKGVDMLIEAAAPLVRQGQVNLDIIGDGPELPRLKLLCEKLGITGGVEFPGWLDHSQITGRLGRANVLGFPSVREFGGGVVLEAMALGVVPIVLDHGGPAELIPPGGGFVLPMGSRASLVHQFGVTLANLAAAPEQLRVLARCAQDHVHQHYTWAAKASQVLEVYDWVLGRRADKPNYSFTPHE